MERAEHIGLRDALIALGVIASWSLNLVLIRAGALEIPPLFLLSIRFFLGTLLFLPFVRMYDRRTILNLLSYAFFYVFCHLAFLYVGALYISASLVGLIIQSGTPFALLLGFVFFGERFGLKTMAGLVLAFAGVFLILYQPVESFSVLGGVLILISAFCWSAGSMRMRSVQHVDLATMTAVSYGAAFPFIAGLSYVIEDRQFEALQEANLYLVGFILAYQVLLMSLSLYLWKGVMIRNPVHQLTAFLVLQPLLVVAFGVLLLGESLNSNELLGGLVLLAGVVIITFRKIKKKVDEPDCDFSASV